MSYSFFTGMWHAVPETLLQFGVVIFNIVFIRVFVYLDIKSSKYKLILLFTFNFQRVMVRKLDRTVLLNDNFIRGTSKISI